MGFRVWGLGFMVWGLGFRVWGSGFRVTGLGKVDPCLGASQETEEPGIGDVPTVAQIDLLGPPMLWGISGVWGLGFRV